MSVSEVSHPLRFGAQILGLALVVGGASPSVAQGLPGGASSLNEVHGDWQVTCQDADGAVGCTISQTQVRGGNRQRLLTIELHGAEGGATGVMVLPFGLALHEGVALSIDENVPLPAVDFSTCLPAGCLVPLSMNEATVAALRVGGALQVETIANEGGQRVGFSVSLKGFSSALNRATELGGS